jgi:tetratricopeptide (TPR) repeat protein
VDELQARLLAELERRTPAGLRRHSVWLQRGSGLLLAVLVPVGAMLLYTQVGDPQAVVRLGQVQESDHMAREGQVQAMVASLAHKLQEEPQNLPGWLMLARSYETLERYGDAAQAYQQALEEARRSGWIPTPRRGCWQTRPMPWLRRPAAAWKGGGGCHCAGPASAADPGQGPGPGRQCRGAAWGHRPGPPALAGVAGADGARVGHGAAGAG